MHCPPHIFLKNFAKNLNRFSVSNFKFYEGDTMIPIQDIIIRSLSGYVFIVPIIVLCSLYAYPNAIPTAL